MRALVGAAVVAALTFFLENAAFVAAAVFLFASLAAMVMMYGRVESLDRRTRRHGQDLERLKAELNLESPDQGDD